METKDLQEVLSRHKRWCSNLEEGCKANLREADLRGADLRRADLREADLKEADLRGADFWEADLGGADLRKANLKGANLRRADLKRAKYGVLDLLQSDWGFLSNELTLELMRHDAELCGDDAMEEWIKTGTCPFQHSGRGFFFVEKKTLWVPGPPKLRGKALLEALAAECNIRL